MREGMGRERRNDGSCEGKKEERRSGEEEEKIGRESFNGNTSVH